MISIKNFVSADIKVEQTKETFNGFKTAVYFTSATITVPAIENGNFTLVNSLSEFENKCTGFTEAVRQSVSEYFVNGGTSLCVVVPTVFTLEGFKEDMRNVTSVTDNYLFVTIANSLVNQPNKYQPADIYAIANFCSGNGWTDLDSKSLNTMRLCLTAISTDFISQYQLNNTLTAVKYSTYTAGGELVDAALVIGSYFAKIDIDLNDPINDYNFTPESIGSGYFEDVNQTTLDELIHTESNGYYNFVGNIANRILNIGGDYANGISISLDFGATCIERDLNYANIELLFGKLPLNNEGQSKLISAIRAQMVKYVDSGFLEQGAVYMGDTKKVTYNGKSYVVISKGDTLPLGYKVFYVPINSISVADLDKKRFPYTYVALQSVHGARLIKIDGSIL